MPERPPTEPTPARRAPKPWYKKRRNQRRVFYVTAAAILVVAAVLILEPSLLFPQTSTSDNSSTIPPGYLSNQIGVRSNLSFSSPPSLQYAFQPSQLSCPASVNKVGQFLCNLQLWNTDPRTHTVSSPTLGTGSAFQVGQVSPPPPWTVASHATASARLTFQVNSGVTTGNYSLNLTLTVQ